MQELENITNVEREDDSDDENGGELGTDLPFEVSTGTPIDQPG